MRIERLIMGVTALCAAGLLWSCATAKTPSVVSVNGQTCKINAVAVCQQIRNGPVNVAGVVGDKQYAEQNSTALMGLSVPLQVPNGSLLNFECQVESRTRAVRYASYLPGPQLTQTDLNFLRQQGLCEQ